MPKGGEPVAKQHVAAVTPSRSRLSGTLAALLLRIWSTLGARRTRPSVGGVVSERLKTLDLEAAVPPGWPSATTTDAHGGFGVKGSDTLARATAWGAAIAAADDTGRDLLRWGVLTTYGFARVRGRVRLAVIRYLPPRMALKPRKTQPVMVDGESFPIVLRPLVVRHHDGRGADGSAAGTCWVTFAADDGPRRGILTANHAIKPAGRAPGTSVSIAALRGEPPGKLHANSPVMDAAIVDVTEANGSRPWPVSPVVGYKPVRLLGSDGPVDTDVVEFTGVIGGTVPGAPGQEPIAPVVLVLGRRLHRGDSGCLVLDLEPVAWGGEPAPYLIYRGLLGVRFGGLAPCALLIEQARRVWGFEVQQSD